MSIHSEKFRKFAFLLAALGFLATTELCLAAGYSAISKEELKSRLGDPQIAILDVRASLGWILSFSKIQGAVRKNPNKVESWQNDFSKGTPIILYCQGEHTSSSVARKLVSAGFHKVYVLKGGWGEWSKAGFPTEKK